MAGSSLNWVLESRQLVLEGRQLIELGSGEQAVRRQFIQLGSVGQAF